jgi:hypothetical protein
MSFYFSLLPRLTLGLTRPPAHWVSQPSFRGLNLTTRIHLVSRSRILDLYLHPLTCLFRCYVCTFLFFCFLFCLFCASSVLRQARATHQQQQLFPNVQCGWNRGLLFGGHGKESATFICAVHAPLNLHMCIPLAKCPPKRTNSLNWSFTSIPAVWVYL